jgi:hypothetical protein
MTANTRPLAVLVLLLSGAMGACKGEPKVSDKGGTTDGGDDGGEDTDWTFAVDGPASAEAGELVTYTVTLTDGDGADRVADATLALALTLPDDNGDDVSGASFTPTLAGDHTVVVQATVDGEVFTESLDLVVAAGPATVIDLVLDATSAEVGGVVGSTTTVTDDWGNPTSGDVVLSADPSEAVTIVGDDLSFGADGLYTITATLDGGTATDTEGPVTVDSNGPFIRIDSPAQGAWLGDVRTVMVVGSVTDTVSAIDTATVNGRDLTLADDGSFTIEILLTEGLSTLTAEAADTDGNTSDALVGVAVGETLSMDDALSDSIRVRMNQDALDVLGDTLAEEVDPAVIEAALLASNPLINTSIGCVDVRVRATALTFGAVDVALDPEPNELGLEIEVADLDFDFVTRIDLCGVSTTNPVGEITATVATITTTATIDVPSAGTADVSLSGTDVVFTDFNADLGGVATLLRSVGLTWSDVGLNLRELTGDALADAVEDALPPALEEALESIVISETFEVLDAEATLDSVLEDVELDADGMTIVLESEISNSGSHPDIPTSPGSWIQGGAAPDYAASPGLMYSVSLDALNRLLHTAWDGGGFNGTFTEDDLGVSEAAIALVFPGATTLDIEMFPQLPPLMSPGAGTDPFDLALGALWLEARGDVDGVDTLLAEGVMVVNAPVTLALTTAGDVEVTIGEGTTTFDFVPEDAGAVKASEDLEDIIGALAGSLSGEMFPELSLPAPEISGFTVTTSDVYEDGADGTWLTVEGELAP